MTDFSHRDADIFAEALRLPAAERAAYLHRVCAGDETLRQRLGELLAIHARLGDFLEQSPRDVETATRSPNNGDKSGDRVGRYKLLEKIGEGGCGVIYLAEQEEPVRRRVALKIIKPGMDTKEVIARFEAERQVLALMDHPGIAKVFDAGETSSGRPYFVMELIRGIKITDYCDRHSATTEERLKLFVQVCQAVQHAHQKGIIHRDIKPSNILVTTTPEGAAQPVVIDFGIAKATNDLRLTDKTLFTAFEMLIGTPTYMSPEQTTLRSTDVDTRTDIYSLGVLLYELLTGSTPFDAGELLQLGIDEVRRAIREQEPLRPSTRLGKMTDEHLTTIAHRRGAEPPTLIRSVRGDLDWIAMKALEKDRARRYETASGLALDVGRFLTNETVSARPASRAYRLQKTVARNKLLFGSLTVISLLLVGGLIVISALLAKERRARLGEAAARRQAEAGKTAVELAAAKSTQVTKFLESMLQGISPQVAQGRDTALLREILEKAVGRIDRELADQPGVRVELQRTIAKTYDNLGLLEQALALNRTALAAARLHHGPESTEVAAIIGSMTPILVRRSESAEALTLTREALAMLRKLHGDDHPAVATAIRQVATVVGDLGQRAESHALFHQAYVIQRKHLGDDHPDVIKTIYGLSIMAYERSEFAEAEAMQEKVLAYSRKVNPAGLGVPRSLGLLGNILTDAGKPALAEPLVREAIAHLHKLYGAAHPELTLNYNALSRSLFLQNKFPEAEEALRRALALKRNSPKPDQETVYILANLAQLLQFQGKLAEAGAVAREAAGFIGNLISKEQQIAAIATARLADALVAQQDFAEADRLFDEFAPPDFLANPVSSFFLQARTDYLAQRGRWADAARDITLALKFRPDDALLHHMLAPLLVATAQTEAYGVHRRNYLAIFTETKTPLTAARVTLDCLALPAPGVDLDALARLAEIATNGGLEGNWSAYAQCGKALLEYRRGNFARAIDRATQSATSLRVELRVLSHAILSMAHFQQKQPAEARAALASARELVAARFPPPGGDRFGLEINEKVPADTGSEWKSGIIARAVLAEATALVEPP